MRIALANRWRLPFRAGGRLVLDLVYPQFCKQCHERLFDLENGFFCPTCWEQLTRIEAPYCTLCGRPHPGMVGYGATNNFPCAECRDAPNKWINTIRGAVTYSDAIETAIKLLKFHGRVRLAAPMAALMADFAQDHLDTAAYTHIVPVPLHKVRARERGFNQSELLARAVWPAFENAILDTQLQRIRPTLTQSRLRGDARHTNVKGAFAYLGEDLAGARIVLIDDVVTTAGTVTECARILKKAGAARVDVLAVALAVPHIVV